MYDKSMLQDFWKSHPRVQGKGRRGDGQGRALLSVVAHSFIKQMGRGWGREGTCDCVLCSAWLCTGLNAKKNWLRAGTTSAWRI